MATIEENIEQFTKDLVAIEDKIDVEELKVSSTYREKIEKLLSERQAVLEKVEGFWPSVFSSPSCVINTFLNGTVDPKIIRAITNFRVSSRTINDKVARKVVINIRSNLFVEEGEVSREIDGECNTLALSEIKWKQGTERARQNSFFVFFEKRNDEDLNKIMDIFDILDSIYQNPFLDLERD